MIATLRFVDLRIPFTTSFRHASAERHETSTAWVEATTDRGIVGHGEGCPRPYVTGETMTSARVFFDAHEASLRRTVHDLESLRAWVAEHASAIDDNPAAWCAIEIALLDAFARSLDHPLERLLGRSPLAGRFRYTAVLGDMSLAAFEALARRYAAVGFTDFKVKISGHLENDRRKLAALLALGIANPRLRVDANNLWQDAEEAVAYLRSLDAPLFAVEEPLPPKRYAELAAIGAALDTRIVLDESLTHARDLARLSDAPSVWIANVRVSKVGGLLRSLDLVEQLGSMGIPVIVGAQVGETSVLTRAALTVAAAAGGRLAGQEGAVGTHLLSRDVCDPPLMFGAGGAIDVSSHPQLSGAGLGIHVSQGA